MVGGYFDDLWDLGKKYGLARIEGMQETRTPDAHNITVADEQPMQTVTATETQPAPVAPAFPEWVKYAAIGGALLLFVLLLVLIIK